MKEFLTQSVAPFASVCAAIGCLTLALFDVPAQPRPVAPPQPVPAAVPQSDVVTPPEPATKAAPAPDEELPLEPGKQFVTRDQLDATLARALRVLNASRPTTMGMPPPQPNAALGATAAPAAAPTAPGPVALAGPPAGLVAPQAGVLSLGQNVGGPPPEGSNLETGPRPDVQLLTTVASLGEAIKSIRNARTEEDIVAAEQQVRLVREQMDKLCGPSGGGPMCDSANQIRSMGF